ncbi:MAG: radical SAM protein [Myxococcota bacterium]|jgi:radical SAM superfamily enzyme YgiQ (UPF0313 family)|nr:radical SAM protein [Myxococcota bacterium]
MRVVFIYPRFEKFLESTPELDRALIDHYIGHFTTPPSLGIPILAALTPPEWEVELVDDNNGDPVDFEIKADLVAISCFTPQATRALELADGYRAAGHKVVMGGFFPSTAPEVALEHCDAVNIGDGEPTWRTILEDARACELKRRYVGGTRFDLKDMPIPRRDIFYEKTGYDWNEDLVQVARGCSYTCGMCAIPTHQGHRVRLRPIEKIVEEIRQLRYDNVYLAEDILFFPGKKLAQWSKELFCALEPLGKKYFVSSTMALATDDALLDSLARAGVNSFYCTLNVDPKSIRALQGDAQVQAELVDLVDRLEGRGIRFFASFGLGRDWDTPALPDTILELCRKAKIRTAEFFIFTPYPGSVHWERLQKQGRILHKNWRHYNGAHVVSRPLGMTEDELYQCFLRIWREFYRPLENREVLETLEPVMTQDHMEERRRSIGLGHQS